MKKMCIIGVCIVIGVYIVLLSGIAFASSIIAITSDGKTVQLNENGTWEYVKVTEHSLTLPDMSERDLFNVAMKEMEEDLFLNYLQKYEGTNIKNTITALYNLANPLYGFSNKRRIPLLVKGVALQRENKKNFMIPVGRFGAKTVSTLALFWELGELLEQQGNYNEALNIYNELKTLYQNEKLPFCFLSPDDGMERIEGKIYLMTLKLQK